MQDHYIHKQQARGRAKTAEPLISSTIRNEKGKLLLIFTYIDAWCYPNIHTDASETHTTSIDSQDEYSQNIMPSKSSLGITRDLSVCICAWMALIR